MAKKSQKSESNTRGSVLSLGADSEDQLIATGNKFLKFDNPNGENVFVLGSAGVRPIREHYVEIEGAEQKAHSFCAVHDLGDEAIINGWAREVCPVCAVVSQLYKASEDESDPFAKEKKELAKDSRSTLSYLVVAAKALSETSRSKEGTLKVTPFLPEKLDWQILRLSAASFRKFFEVLQEEGHESGKVPGLFVNFTQGKPDGKGFTQTLSVELWKASPKFKKPNVKELPDLSVFGNPDHEMLRTMADSLTYQVDSLADKVVSKARAKSKKRG